MKRIVFGLAIYAGLSALAMAAAPHLQDGRLVDSKKMSLYVFDQDQVGQPSACTGDCSLLWPPALAATLDLPGGDYTLLVRPDGKRQWLYQGHPLYRWSGDHQPGDVKGDGKGGIWHKATPAMKKSGAW